MDSNTDDTRPVIALPGVCARVRVPQVPNFLQPITGGGPIDLADLTRTDVLALGLALHRALVANWCDRFAAKHGASEREAEALGVELLHPAIVERLAMADAGREGYAWGDLTQRGKEDRIERTRSTLTDFAQELCRYG